MDGDAASSSIEKNPRPLPPLLKLRTDIFKEGVVIGPVEVEEGEVDTTSQSPLKRKIENEVSILTNRIKEKRKKIAELQEEIAADKSEIGRIILLKVAETKISKQGSKNPKHKYCELCNVMVCSDKARHWQGHLNGKRHRTRELEVAAERDCYIVTCE